MMILWRWGSSEVKNLTLVIPTEAEESLLLSWLDIERTVLFITKKNQKVLEKKTRFHWYSTKLPSSIGAQTLLVPKPPSDSEYENQLIILN